MSGELHDQYVLELENQLAEAAEFEKACREWLKGCSCAGVGEQENCYPCTIAFLNHLKKLNA